MALRIASSRCKLRWPCRVSNRAVSQAAERRLIHHGGVIQAFRKICAGGLSESRSDVSAGEIQNFQLLLEPSASSEAFVQEPGGDYEQIRDVRSGALSECSRNTGCVSCDRDWAADENTPYCYTTKNSRPCAILKKKRTPPFDPVLQQLVTRVPCWFEGLLPSSQSSFASARVSKCATLVRVLTSNLRDVNPANRDHGEAIQKLH